MSQAANPAGKRMRIRRLNQGEELALREIFFSSVHQLAKNHYSPEQLRAWSPMEFDRTKWISQIQALQPWVVLIDGELAAYADVQSDGYIDHFYVSGGHGGKGIGSALMAYLLAEARRTQMDSLYSKVSFSAQPLFLKNGFGITSVNTFMLRGIEISNATMVRKLRA
ncbi:MAG: GNAT family N-acetyltransferase [Sterolibacterium sp.]